MTNERLLMIPEYSESFAGEKTTFVLTPNGLRYVKVAEFEATQGDEDE